MGNTSTQKKINIDKLVAIGLMSALVFAGNFISIPLVNETRIHVGNAVCLLSGLLFGGISGGLASGIGGALYDLTNPLYITSAPVTFISKFAMGWTAGQLNRSKIKNPFVRALISALVGQIVYIVLYLGKSLVTQLIIGSTFKAAATIMLAKAVTSLINGGIAVVVSVPLYFAIKKAFSASKFRSLI